MTLTNKNIFLLDAVGATTSAFFLGVILPAFEDFFGMPKIILFFLASLACMFAVYSFACFFHKPENWRLFLRIIAIVNIFYCCLTLILVIYFFDTLTLFDKVYFFVEFFLISTLVNLEVKLFF